MESMVLIAMKALERVHQPVIPSLCAENSYQSATAATNAWLLQGHVLQCGRGTSGICVRASSRFIRCSHGCG